MTTNEEIRENFLEFCRSIELLGQLEANAKLGTKSSIFQHQVSGSILDRFRAVRNSSQNPAIRTAVNDSIHTPVSTNQSRIKSIIPSFLMMGRNN